VVHRDIRPANIVVLGSDVSGPSLEIKIIDFGLAYGMDSQFVRCYRQVLLRKVSARQTPMVSRQRAWSLGRHFSGGSGHSNSDSSARGTAGTLQLAPTEVDPKLVSAMAHGGVAAQAIAAGAPGGAAMARDRGREGQGEGQGEENSSSFGAKLTPAIRAQPSRYSFTVEPSGSRLYAAPETHDHHRYRASLGSTGDLGIVVDATVVVDAFSVGAVLHHLLTGVPPGRKVAEYISRKTSNPISLVGRVALACAGRPVPHYRYMAELHDVKGVDLSALIARLMERDPAKRMTITQLNEDEWVAGADVPSLRAYNGTRHAHV
jgi:serine/threonine protein kinase